MPAHDGRVNLRRGGGRTSVALLGLSLLLAPACRKASEDETSTPGDAQSSGIFAEQAYSGSGTPTPAMLCDHVMSMMMRETGAELSPEMPELQALLDECVRDGEQNRAQMGEAAYREQASCVLAAEYYDDLALCGDGDDSDAPPPQVVCDHVVDLMLIELGDQASAMPVAEIEGLRSECVASATQERLDDPEDYASEASCVLAARRLDDLERCEELDPVAAGPVGSDRDRQMCMHIVTLLDREAAGSGVSLTREQIEEFVATCVVDFQAERRALGNAAAEALIDCALAAATADQLLACEDR